MSEGRGYDPAYTDRLLRESRWREALECLLDAGLDEAQAILHVVDARNAWNIEDPWRDSDEFSGQWYRRAADTGDPTAMLRYGEWLERRGRMGDAQPIFDAVGEDVTAILRLARWIRRRDGDIDAARRWLTPLAERGQNRAIAWLNEQTDPVRDEPQYRQRARAGDVEAMLTVVERAWTLGDTAFAAAWTRKAAEEGSAKAMLEVAKSLQRELPWAEAWPEAERWYRAATSANSPETFTLREAYYGLGDVLITTNRAAKALPWLRGAADAGKWDFAFEWLIPRILAEGLAEESIPFLKAAVVPDGTFRRGKSGHVGMRLMAWEFQRLRRPDETERWLRMAADTGNLQDQQAFSDWLHKDDRESEAITYREAADEQDPSGNIRRPPSPLGSISGAVPESLEIVVHVASYIGAAGAGGVIGNRVDAGVTAVVSRMFKSVGKKWKRRRKSKDSPLDREVAAEAATAAVITQDYRPDSVHVTSMEQEQSGGWIVLLNACPSRDEHLVSPLRVRVPTGDPSRATIIILPG